MCRCDYGPQARQCAVWLRNQCVQGRARLSWGQSPNSHCELSRVLARRVAHGEIMFSLPAVDPFRIKQEHSEVFRQWTSALNSTGVNAAATVVDPR